MADRQLEDHPVPRLLTQRLHLSRRAALVAGGVVILLATALLLGLLGGGDTKRSSRADSEVVLGQERIPSRALPSRKRPAQASAPSAERDKSKRQVGLRQLAGQSVMVAIGPGGPTSDLLRRVRTGQIGGVIIMSGVAPAAARSAASALQDAARSGGAPQLLIATDQEGGAVKRFPGPPDRSPPQLGAAAPAAAEDAGRATGRYLASLGINVDLAPVLDVASGQSFISARTFGDDPGAVGERGTRFIVGLQDAGVAATAKHFPGLGGATRSPDLAPTSVQLSRERLERDLKPFEAAVAGGVELVMTSTAAYPALGVQGPAAFSREMVSRLLRGRLNFGGVVITDDLETPAVKARGTSSSAAVSAIQAGTDIVLFAKSEVASAAAYEEIVRAVSDGRLDRRTLERSYDRIVALKRQLPG